MVRAFSFFHWQIQKKIHSLNDNSANHVLMVDDDILLHKLVGEYVCTRGCVLHSLICGEDMLTYLQQQQPQLIALDIMMPGRDGLYWLAWLREHYPHLPVLLLSSKASAGDRLKGLELGAADYLIKPFHPKELLIRIKHILRREPASNRLLIQIGEFQFDPTQECLLTHETQIRLTTLETRLLTFFCQNAGHILSRDAISHALNGNEHQPLNRSIDMAVNRLRKKLNEDLAAPRHLHTVWRKGYRFVINP